MFHHPTNTAGKWTGIAWGNHLNSEKNEDSCLDSGWFMVFPGASLFPGWTPSHNPNRPWNPRPGVTEGAPVGPWSNPLSRSCERPSAHSKMDSEKWKPWKNHGKNHGKTIMEFIFVHVNHGKTRNLKLQSTTRRSGFRTTPSQRPPRPHERLHPASPQQLVDPWVV